jgi:hypothetical protein
MAHPPLLKQGDRFNRLTIDSWDKSKKRYKCICDCGKITYVASYQLKKGYSRSCGCLGRQLTSQRNYKPDNASAKNTLYLKYKKNAEARGHEFLLTPEDVVKLTAGKCHYCDQPPSMKLIETKRYRHAESTFVYNGIDRVNNSVGYTVENSVSCCKLCNLSKRDLPIEIWLDWIDRVHEFQHRQ